MTVVYTMLMQWQKDICMTNTNQITVSYLMFTWIAIITSTIFILLYSDIHDVATYLPTDIL